MTTHHARFVLVAQAVAFGVVLLVAAALGVLPVPPGYGGVDGR